MGWDRMKEGGIMVERRPYIIQAECRNDPKCTHYPPPTQLIVLQLREDDHFTLRPNLRST